MARRRRNPYTKAELERLRKRAGFLPGPIAAEAAEKAKAAAAVTRRYTEEREAQEASKPIEVGPVSSRFPTDFGNIVEGSWVAKQHELAVQRALEAKPARAPAKAKLVQGSWFVVQGALLTGSYTKQKALDIIDTRKELARKVFYESKGQKRLPQPWALNVKAAIQKGELDLLPDPGLLGKKKVHGKWVEVYDPHEVKGPFQPGAHGPGALGVRSLAEIWMRRAPHFAVYHMLVAPSQLEYPTPAELAEMYSDVEKEDGLTFYQALEVWGDLTETAREERREWERGEEEELDLPVAIVWESPAQRFRLAISIAEEDPGVQEELLEELGFEEEAIEDIDLAKLFPGVSYKPLIVWPLSSAGTKADTHALTEIALATGAHNANKKLAAAVRRAQRQHKSREAAQDPERVARHGGKSEVATARARLKELEQTIARAQRAALVAGDTVVLAQRALDQTVAAVERMEGLVERATKYAPRAPEWAAELERRQGMLQEVNRRREDAWVVLYQRKGVQQAALEELRTAREEAERVKAQLVQADPKLAAEVASQAQLAAEQARRAAEREAALQILHAERDLTARQEWQEELARRAAAKAAAEQRAAEAAAARERRKAEVAQAKALREAEAARAEAAASGRTTTMELPVSDEWSPRENVPHVPYILQREVAMLGPGLVRSTGSYNEGLRQAFKQGLDNLRRLGYINAQGRMTEAGIKASPAIPAKGVLEKYTHLLIGARLERRLEDLDTNLRPNPPGIPWSATNVRTIATSHGKEDVILYKPKVQYTDASGRIRETRPRIYLPVKTSADEPPLVTLGGRVPTVDDFRRESRRVKARVSDAMLDIGQAPPHYLTGERVPLAREKKLGKRAQQRRRSEED